MKRQSTSSPIDVLSAISAVGITISTMATAMIRLRPTTSATMPTKGAPKATAKVVAPIVRLTSAGLASKSPREERKQRLRRVEIDEGAEARKSDREPAGIGEH